MLDAPCSPFALLLLSLPTFPGLHVPRVQGARNEGRLPLPADGSGAVIGTAARVLQLSRLVQVCVGGGRGGGG